MSRTLGIMLIFIILFSALPLPANAQTPQTASVTGAAIDLPTSEESKYLKSMQELTDSLPVTSRSNVFVLYTGKTRYIVYTDTEPQAGKATVKGTVFTPEELGGGSSGIIFADSVSVTTKGREVTLEELRDHSAEYDGKLVRITAPYRQLSYSLDASEGKFVDQQAAGAFNAFGGERFIEAPGRSGRWVTLNLSGNSYGADRNTEITRKLGLSPTVAMDYSDTRFWINARTTVDAVVLSDENDAGLLIVDTSVNSRSINGVKTISGKGEQFDGDVVSFETQVLGTRTSSQELLLSVAQCAPSSVTNPVTGCLPVPTDMTIHSGVFLSKTPSELSDAVLYAGISNHHQQTVMTPEQGTYRVTGRVVSTDRIDPSLPEGYALIVYEMDRTGNLQIGASTRKKTEQLRSKLTNTIQAQLTDPDYQVKEQRDAHTDSNTGKATRTEPAEVQIVHAKIVKNPIESDETGQIRTVVRNSGGEIGTIKLKFRTGRSLSEPREVRTVRVEPGDQKTVTFTYRFTGPSKTGIRIWINHRDLGLLERELPGSTSTSTRTDDQSGVITALRSPLAALVGAVFALSGGLVGVIWAGMGFPYGGFGDISARSFGGLLSVGAFLLTLVAVTSGIGSGEVGLLCIAAGGGLGFLMGWSWSLGGLFRKYVR